MPQIGAHKRIEYLDLMRGLLILYVVFVHMSLTYGYISFGDHNGYAIFDCLSFFMVPFFVNSGFMFRSMDETYTQNFRANIVYVKNNILRKTKKLLNPYIFWFALSFAVYSVYLSFLHVDLNITIVLQPLLYTMGPLCDTPLWFLWTLFCVNALYQLFNALFSFKQLHLVIMIAFILAFVAQMTQIQFFGSGNICLGLFYYHVGRIMRKYNIVRYLKLKIFLPVLLFYIIINIYYPQYMAFVTLTLSEGDFFTNALFSLAGVYILWYVCFKIKSIKWLNFIGVNSLVLFVSHRVILNWIYDPIITRLYAISYIPYTLLGFAVILSLFLLINWFLKKYVPFAVGN